VPGSEALAGAVVALQPGAVPAHPAAPVIEGLVNRCRQDCRLTGGEQRVERPVEFRRWWYPEHCDVRDAVEQEAIGAQITGWVKSVSWTRS
jgi:hypothetical protein